MRKTFAITALAAALALPLIAAPTAASASCEGRKNTGMVLGGVGGALIGNSVSKGGTGAVIGGLGGAVLGHQVAKSGCSSQRYTRASSRNRATAARSAPAKARKVYYDQYGNPVGAVAVR